MCEDFPESERNSVDNDLGDVYDLISEAHKKCRNCINSSNDSELCEDVFRCLEDAKNAFKNHS